MKTLKLIFTILMVLITSNTIMAQEKKTDTTSIKKDNLMDMQTNILTSMLGSNLDGNVDGKSIGYLELLEKSDLTEAQKTEYKNLYYLQAKDLTKKQEDSLCKVIEKKILEAKKTND